MVASEEEEGFTSWAANPNVNKEPEFKDDDLYFSN
jgi:hypothetical protein